MGTIQIFIELIYTRSKPQKEQEEDSEGVDKSDREEPLVRKRKSAS